MRLMLALILAATWSLPILALPTAMPGDALSSAEDMTQLAKRKRRKKRKTKTKVKPAEEAAPTPAPAPAPEPAAETGEGGGDEGVALTRRGPARIDFDERLIKGQTNKANAIYLFERRSSSLRTLVKKRTHFHEEIDDSLQ